eukprot:TRINITY_DN66986_c4_g1_i3.p1 TRINITY_DN66986_c4_g1~~TRINITY_DN66986_c4_g1_i3.p1  ORF type:complete len:208 (+),score=19.11 TRINITY_DN66986_c4_g1_i3:89-712(+)
MQPTRLSLWRWTICRTLNLDKLSVVDRVIHRATTTDELCTAPSRLACAWYICWEPEFRAASHEQWCLLVSELFATLQIDLHELDADDLHWYTLQCHGMRHYLLHQTMKFLWAMAQTQPHPDAGPWRTKFAVGPWRLCVNDWDSLPLFQDTLDVFGLHTSAVVARKLHGQKKSGSRTEVPHKEPKSGVDMLFFTLVGFVKNPLPGEGR